MIATPCLLPMICFAAGVLFCWIALALGGVLRSRDEYFLNRLAAGRPVPRDWNPGVGVGLRIVQNQGYTTKSTKDGWLVYRDGEDDVQLCIVLEMMSFGRTVLMFKGKDDHADL